MEVSHSLLGPRYVSMPLPLIQTYLDSVSVYYVAVRTIVLSRYGSNLARPVIIHDIIDSFMCMPSAPHRGFSGVSPDGNCAYVH